MNKERIRIDIFKKTDKIISALLSVVVLTEEELLEYREYVELKNT